jgi:ATP-binding cassette subfamily B protein
MTMNKRYGQLAGNTNKKIGIIARMLGTSWKLRKSAVIGYLVGAALEITGSLMTIYATAQLGSLLARYISGKSTHDIWFWLVIDVLSTIASSLGFWLMSFTQRRLYFVLTQWSTRVYMQQLCNIDFPDHYDREVRDQINKVETGFSWMMSNLSNSCLELCYGVARLIAITVVVAQISWWILPIIVVFLLPSLVAEARLAQLQWFVFDDKSDQRHVFWQLFYIFKQARAQMEIRSLQAKGYLTTKIDRMNETFYTIQEKRFMRATPGVVSSKILEAAGVTIGSIVLIKRFLNGAISFDRYLFLSGALLRVGGALNAVFGTLTRMQEPLLYAETFYAFADRPIKMIDKPAAYQLPNVKSPEIVFKNLSFSYPRSKRPILDDLNLTIKAGEHVAIVGENGAGKSTLIKLLMRFYEPVKGSIHIDGHDLADVAIESWYARLATLFQDFNRYPFSIRENIEMSEKPADDARFQKAARLGGVDTIITTVPKGAETILDSSFKGGIEPSGGQYQRVGLSRAFYRDASLLILDEPTAAIDAKAEYDIFNNIFDEYKDKTAIIVSHRFSTVRRADRIVVLDGGRVIEEGSHEKLMKNKGLYHDMFTKQAEGYR